MLTLATFVAVLVIGLWWDGARCGHQPNKPQSQFQFTPRQKVLEIVGHEAESSGIICFSFLFVQTVYPLKSTSWKGPRQQESFLLNLIITVWRQIGKGLFVKFLSAIFSQAVGV